MKTDCEVIRDLLPLYADDACSEKSREMVNEHLLDCAECRTMLGRLKETEIEADLRTEKKAVIEYGAKRMKRRSAQVGSVISWCACGSTSPPGRQWAGSLLCWPPWPWRRP